MVKVPFLVVPKYQNLTCNEDIIFYLSGVHSIDEKAILVIRGGASVLKEVGVPFLLVNTISMCPPPQQYAR